jgi:hypothetical protein
MMGGDSSETLEPLNVKDRRVCRWVQNITLLFVFWRWRLLIIIKSMVLALSWKYLLNVFAKGHNWMLYWTRSIFFAILYLATLKIHFNNILKSMTWSHKWSHHVMIFSSNVAGISHFPLLWAFCHPLLSNC